MSTYILLLYIHMLCNRIAQMMSKIEEKMHTNVKTKNKSKKIKKSVDKRRGGMI